ncbi:MAG: sugar kinase, partial [Candidatus Hydrogenedentota bacterium]
MGKLTVVGSIAYDTVETPFGKLERRFGGSAIYFSVAASLFTPVYMIGVVGDDFDLNFLKRLEKRRIDYQG